MTTTTTLTRVQLRNLFELGTIPTQPETEGSLTPYSPPDPDLLLIQIANILSWPVTEIKISSQCGRFLVVDCWR